jgi:hypothetical protein
VNHKTQKQNHFCKVQVNHGGDCEDYHVLGFHATCSGRSVPALLNNWLPPSSGQAVVFPKTYKMISLQYKTLLMRWQRVK